MTVPAKTVVESGRLVASVNSRKAVYLYEGKFYLVEFTGNCWDPKGACTILLIAESLSEIESYVRPQILVPISA